MSLELLKSKTDQLLTKFSQFSTVSFIDTVDKNILGDIISDWGDAADRVEIMTLKLETDFNDIEAMDDIKRTLHNIKGDCGVFGLNDVSDMFHHTETLVEHYIETHTCPSELLLGVVDLLRKILGKIVAGEVHEQVKPQKTSHAPVKEIKKQSLKILVVDDDFVNRLLLQQILKQYGEVHMAVDGEEAVTAIFAAMDSKEPYDLVCLDIMMPNMDGQEALKLVRKEEKRLGIMTGRGVKVLMTTALDDSKNVMASFKGQCDGYIVKPISQTQLLKEMTTLSLIK